MPYAAAMSEHPIATQATGEVVGQVLEAIGDRPDLAVVFVTASHAGALEDVASTIREVLHPGTLLGTTAVSVLGGDHEVEEQPAITLFAARLGQPVIPVRLDTSTSAGVAISGLSHDLVGDEDERTLVLLADPFSMPVDAFLDAAPETYPGLRVIGGLASAARGPGGNRLILDEHQYSDGAVGALLPSGGGLQAVVSQGCRPIGTPMTVTRSDGAVPGPRCRVGRS